MTDVNTKIGGETTTNGAPAQPIVPAAPAGPLIPPVDGPAYNGPVVKANAGTANQGGTTPTGLVINSDGTTNYQASLDAVKAKALDLQKKANDLAARNSTGTSSSSTSKTDSPIVSSSSSVVTGEKKISQDVTDLTATNDASTKAHQDYLDNLANQTAALEARRASEVAGINSQFDTEKSKTIDAQNRETGTFTSTLARIGGYLGDSASASGALINLAQQHTFQLGDLEAKRQSAIQAAKNAIDDKEFAIANLKATEAKDYAKQIADNKQQFFDNSIKVLQAQQSQDSAQRAAIKDQLTNLAYVDPKSVSKETKSSIDQFYGTPGFTDQYLAVNKQANDAKSSKDKTDAQNSLLQLLQNIPQGQKVTFPDGTEYTGMGKAGDVSTFLQVDNAGQGHLITYNKITGVTNAQNVGTVGKTSGSGSGGTTLAKTNPVVVDNATNIFQQSLEANKDKNGNYDPDTYISLRNQLKESKNPQLVQYMDKLFLNKANGYFNDAAISRLRSKGIYYGDTTLPPDNTTDATGNDVQTGQ